MNATSGLQLNSLLYRFHPGVLWTRTFPRRDEILSGKSGPLRLSMQCPMPSRDDDEAQRFRPFESPRQGVLHRLTHLLHVSFPSLAGKGTYLVLELAILACGLLPRPCDRHGIPERGYHGCCRAMSHAQCFRRDFSTERVVRLFQAGANRSRNIYASWKLIILRMLTCD